MKILVLGAGGDGTGLANSYKRAFETLGHDVTALFPPEFLAAEPMWHNPLLRRLCERQIIERSSQRLLARMLENDADAIWIAKGAWAAPDLWNAYREKRPNTKLICYNPDDPVRTHSRGGNRPWITESIPCFDIFCTYNSSLVQPLQDLGARHVLRLPFAWDPAIHPMQLASSYTLDLVFVGNGDRHREHWLVDILKSPLSKRWRVAVFGQWSRFTQPLLQRHIRGAQIVGAEMAEAVAQSKVSLNILREQNEGSHNMRTFETPGCGGLSASQYSDEQHEFFPDQQAAIYFRTPEEAAAKIDEVVNDSSLLSRLREGARTRVRDQTYVERAATLLARI